MKLDRDQLQKDIHALYRREHEELGAEGTLAMLERAADFPLADVLNAGGVLVFPACRCQGLRLSDRGLRSFLPG